MTSGKLRFSSLKSVEILLHSINFGPYTVHASGYNFYSEDKTHVFAHFNLFQESTTWVGGSR